MALWNEHLMNYELRGKLSRHFNFGNVDTAVQDFEATDKILHQTVKKVTEDIAKKENQLVELKKKYGQR